VNYIIYAGKDFQGSLLLRIAKIKVWFRRGHSQTAASMPITPTKLYVVRPLRQQHRWNNCEVLDEIRLDETRSNVIKIKHAVRFLPCLQAERWASIIFQLFSPTQL